MKTFTYISDILHIRNTNLHVIAKKFGTPSYVYFKQNIIDNYSAFEKSFTNIPCKINYAVKANSNLSILNLFVKLGSGFDIVSAGELARVLKAGANGDDIIFSGVGKTREEIEQALNAEVFCLNIESHHELLKINEIAKNLNVIAPIAFRINPDIDAKSHPYISTGLKENKFGIPYEEAISIYQEAKQLKHILIRGIGCHIGSQITKLSPFENALDRILKLISELSQIGIQLEHINMGGGLGVAYHNEMVPTVEDYALCLTNKLKKINMKLLIEPGRAMIADAGILLTKILYIKCNSSKNFLIVDAAMNDLLRPALYDSWHNIVPIQIQNCKPLIYDIESPICESSDYIGKARELKVKEDDFLAVADVGAYGFSMASNYNSRLKPCEIMVDNQGPTIIRARETIKSLFRLEN